MAGTDDLNENTITAAVIEQLGNTPDPRLKRIMTSLVEHLHAVAREVELTEDEWFAGIDFLTRVGQACSATRQEFILLSDTLGLSQLVVAQNHHRVPGAAEQTILGPFHVAGAPSLPDGANIAEGVHGEPLFVTVQVTSMDRAPIVGATAEVWHADAEGHYDVQDPGWSPDEMKLRGVFVTDRTGRFTFRTIMPRAYPVPTDGPVGELLHATARTAMRPAHIHFRIAALGYDTLVTHIFPEGDPWLEADAVFGVRTSCVVPFVYHRTDEPMPDGTPAREPFYTVDYTFRLQPV
jgi:hydroxyquinol 1,2-dioxygenase